MELCRYVVLNLVRAGMVRSARDHGWNSYRATAGLGAAYELFCKAWLLGQFGEARTEAHHSYCRFVSDGVGGATPCSEARGQLFLGQEDFVETIRAKLRRARQLPEVPRPQRYADRPG